MKTDDADIIAGCFRTFLADPTVKTITAFIPPVNDAKHRVRVTRRQKRSPDFHVSIGGPNYEERQFLADCRKANTDPKHSYLKRFK